MTCSWLPSTSNSTLSDLYLDTPTEQSTSDKRKIVFFAMLKEAFFAFYTENKTFRHSSL